LSKTLSKETVDFRAVFRYCTILNVESVILRTFTFLLLLQWPPFRIYLELAFNVIQAHRPRLMRLIKSLIEQAWSLVREGWNG
jgi:hypothetical protein